VQRKVYTKDVHRIELQHIDKDALYVLEKLVAMGHIAYLVGGGVRDLLLGQRPKDYDISTSAKPEEIRKLFRNCILIGRRFRLAHIRFGKKIIEASTFRSGDPEDDSLILRDNEWGTPEQDVLRRDFTINGLFYDAAQEAVIDYVGGFEDLERREIKAIGQPFIRFRQDPVRMLRLLKFRARFGFSVDHDAHTALIETKHEILKSSPARVFEEIMRMLESGSAHVFFSLLMEYGLLPLILPGLSSFLDGLDGEEVYSLIQEVDRMVKEGQTLDRALLITCLFFPLLQKRVQMVFSNKEKPPHLGEIQEIAYVVFHETIDCFFHVPRRLKMISVSLAVLQFRLVPMEQRKGRGKRVPKDPCFSLAVHFLYIRSCIDPGLQKTVLDWQNALQNLSKEEVGSSSPLGKRRRSRGRSMTRQLRERDVERI